METIPNNKEECVKWLKEHNIGYRYITRPPANEN